MITTRRWWRVIQAVSALDNDIRSAILHFPLTVGPSYSFKREAVVGADLLAITAELKYLSLNHRRDE